MRLLAVSVFVATILWAAASRPTVTVTLTNGREVTAELAQGLQVITDNSGRSTLTIREKVAKFHVTQVTASFTLVDVPVRESIRVFRNGVLQEELVDYTLNMSVRRIDFLWASQCEPGDSVLVSYRY